jgi:hypothetical protein
MVLALPHATAGTRMWYVDYDQAIRAVKRQEYQSAELILTDLIQRQGVSRAYVRTYGHWVIDYTPYYYLGLALAGQNRPDDAARAFRAELNFGVVQGSPEKMMVIERHTDHSIIDVSKLK